MNIQKIFDAFCKEVAPIPLVYRVQATVKVNAADLVALMDDHIRLQKIISENQRREYAAYLESIPMAERRKHFEGEFK